MKDYTICAYMRLSQEDDDIFGRKVESGSITAQRQMIMNFIDQQPEFKGCKVIERCDDGLSGRYFDTRPQFTDMIEQTKKGRINCIIVKDCSRFGRDYVELGDYLEQLFPFLGVRFIAINDHYDSDKTEGGLDIAFKNLVYDIYSRDLSKKLRETRKQMAAQGKYFAGQTLYGYRKQKKNKHKLEVDPEAAKVVKEIFDMRLAGMGLTDIAKNLNDRGIGCPTVYKHEKGETVNHTSGFENMYWTSGTVLIILSNEEYTGAVVALKSKFDRATRKFRIKPKDEWVRTEGMHEAIISKEDFDAVQALLKPQKKPRAKKIMHYRCCNCGRNLLRRNGTDLYCTMGYFHSEESACMQVKAKEPAMDELVLEELKKKLQRVLDADELRLKDKKAAGESVESLRPALEAVKQGKQKLFEKLADRQIDRETFKSKKAAYDEDIAALEQKISDAAMAEALAEDRADAVETARSFLDITEMTDEVWDRFVKDVIVYPGPRLEIIWNFEE